MIRPGHDSSAVAKALAEATYARTQVPGIASFWREVAKMGLRPPRFLTPWEVAVLKAPPAERDAELRAIEEAELLAQAEEEF